MSDTYKVAMVVDMPGTDKNLTMTGTLEIVCAALTKALSFPPYGLVSLKVERA